MEKLVYILAEDVNQGRKIHFELIRMNIRAKLFTDADSCILNALFSKPDLIVADAALTKVSSNSFEHMLNDNPFKESTTVWTTKFVSDEEHTMLTRMRQVLFNLCDTSGKRKKMA